MAKNVRTDPVFDTRGIDQQKSGIRKELLSQSAHKDLAQVFLGHMSLSDLEREQLCPHIFSDLVQNMERMLQQKKMRQYKLEILEQIAEGTEHTSILIVNDDMPFLVDSITNILRNKQYTIKLLVHPVIDVERSGSGKLEKFSAANPEGSKLHKESLMMIQLTEKLSKSETAELHQAMEAVLKDIFYAVVDWQTVRQRVSTAIENIAHSRTEFTEERRNEISSFLRWLDDGYFTFLGFREYEFSAKAAPKIVEALGIFKNDSSCLYKKSCDGSGSDLIECSDPFLITKTIERSTVHRNTPMDVIRLKKFDEQGKVVGEYEFVGLFTSAVYTGNIKDFPILRKKLDYVMKKSGLSPSWHDGKTLIHILETYPRDELFQVKEADLFKASKQILELQERQRLTVLVRKDSLGHMVTCLVYVPRERYTSSLRDRMGFILESQMEGEITSFIPTIDPDLPYARVYYTIAKDPQKPTDFHMPTLEKALSHASLAWSDLLHHRLQKHHKADTFNAIKKQFVNAFPVYYQEQFTPEVAIQDIECIQEVFQKKRLLVQLHQKTYDQEETLNLKLYHPDEPVPLSDILPILENMGLRVITEINYRITEQVGKQVVYLHDFHVVFREEVSKNFAEMKELFEEALFHIWSGRVENDGFNTLILAAGISWQRIVILRAYYKYMKQIDFMFSQSFVEECLLRNAHISTQLIELFRHIFDPKTPDNDPQTNKLLSAVEKDIEQVEKSEDDTILAQYVNLITATLRTNYFQRTKTGELKEYLIFKFNASMVQNLPSPKPEFEMFIYSPVFEAVHLRTGKVARGGLRWSDRREDFRKEILGLMKAQKVKNTVIIPVGAKGGFVIKQDLKIMGHEERLALGIQCYQNMIQAMLDITDNMKKNRVVKPKNVRCYDGHDPYLVVAADKGTATFSDIANEISLNNNFWLGDAFASGGSHGYDHKKMGITAKGAWESVKRHFREMGIDTQTTPFTVIGIGDMAGDVFGNGMLLSKKIKLVAAFNHMHIFVDPNPDPETSYHERKRLFEMPRSTWMDYNQKLLSKGGEIFSRNQKKLTLNSEIRQALKIQKKEISPNELIKRILMAPAELLWFGGIGTYIKSSLETDDDAGDRNNDLVRVEAPMLRCKVIGEGANLGVTQNARIEYALAGGRINTDAIDNSAGVDCSDHEVNIKILLQESIDAKKLDEKKRNNILVKMTDEVSELVLRNNYLQTQTISMLQARGYHVLERQNRLIKNLERNGTLDRALEYLPDDDMLAERMRMHQGLTRPEIAVLLAYGKIFAYDKILETTLPDDKGLATILVKYFPTLLKEKFLSFIESHPLRREIITTYAANTLVNRQGPTFLNEMMSVTGAHAGTIMQGYFVARDALCINDYWGRIELLDYKVEAKVQIDMMLSVVGLVDSSTLWVIQHGNMTEGIQKCADRYHTGFKEFSKHLKTFIVGTNKKWVKKETDSLRRKAVPDDLAFDIVGLNFMKYGWDVIKIAQENKKSVLKAGELYFEVGQYFRVDWLRHQTKEISSDNRWRKKTVHHLAQHLNTIQRFMTQEIFAAIPGNMNADERIKAWVRGRQEPIAEYNKIMGEITSASTLEMDMISVAMQELGALIDL